MTTRKNEVIGTVLVNNENVGEGVGDLDGLVVGSRGQIYVKSSEFRASVAVVDIAKRAVRARVETGEVDGLAISSDRREVYIG